MEIVGEENQNLSCLFIFKFYPAHFDWVIFGCIVIIEKNGLIIDHTMGNVLLIRINALIIHIVFGPCNKKSSTKMNFIKPSIIHIPPVNNVKAIGFKTDNIQHVDIMN